MLPLLPPAILENVDPTDLPITLHDYVDPESLDALMTNSSCLTISFTVDEYQIRITGNDLLITSE